jgi:D-xylose transport system substrate-binding protein
MFPGFTTRATAGVLLVAAFAVGAAGCGSSSSDKSSTSSQSSGASGGKGAKIALLLPENKTARYEAQDKPSFVARVKQLCPSCEVLYENANQDAAKQQQQAEAALTQGAKVLVLDAVDVQAAASIATRAKQSNVPVVSYGRLVANSPLDYYVSIDPYKVGVQQAQVLMDALKQQGKTKPRIVMINGSPTDSNAPPYKKGAHSVFDPAGVKVVKEFDTPDWSPDKAQQEMEQTITAVGAKGFDAVYVANDGMASGVVAAMKAAHVDPAKVPVTGQDAEVTGVQRILTNEQLMTVYQPISKIASASAEIAVPLAQGKTPPKITNGTTNNGKVDVPSVLLPTIAITKSNIKDTVVKDGFVKPADLCTAKYAKACQEAGIQ